MNDEKTNPTSELNIEIRDIDSIRPYEKNPRLNDKAVDAVATSLKEFGFRQPIVVDSDGVIIAGHTIPVPLLRMWPRPNFLYLMSGQTVGRGMTLVVSPMVSTRSVLSEP